MPQPRSKFAVATVVTRSHYGAARALFGAAPMQLGGFDRVVCLIDDFTPTPDECNFSILRPSELDIPQLPRFLFQYTPLELACASKPYLLRRLLAAGYERVIYLDSDVYVCNSLDPLFAGLDAASILLTPHLTQSTAGESAVGWERVFLQVGVFNAGFIAVKNTEQATRFLDWWSQRTLHQCVNVPECFAFVDQIWLNLAPCLFGEVEIVRDPGVNVAYWNVYSRTLSLTPAGQWLIDGVPLLFFHFSGYDHSRPESLSCYDGVYDPNSHPLLARLLSEYTRHLSSHDCEKYRSLGYGHARLDNGEEIRPEWREAIRIDHPFLKGIADPFRTAAYTDLREKFANVERLVGADPSLSRFRRPHVEMKRLDELRRSWLFGPLLKLFRLFGLIDWK